MSNDKQNQKVQLRKYIDTDDAAWFERVCDVGGYKPEGLFRRMRLAYEAFESRNERIPGIDVSEVLPVTSAAA